MRRVPKVGVALIGSASVIACHRESGTEASAVPTLEPSRYHEAANPQQVSAEQAVESVAIARCDREAACGHIGWEHNYPTRQKCVDDLTIIGRDELRDKECRAGVDSQELSKCLAEVRGERCGDPLDAVGRLGGCRVGALCGAAPKSPARDLTDD